MSNSNKEILICEIEERKEQIIMFQKQIDSFQNAINISHKYISECEKKLRGVKVDNLKNLSDV